MSKPITQLVIEGGGLTRPAVAGDGPLLMLGQPRSLATVGAGALLAGLLTSGLLMRTGPTAAYADTVDTGANMDIAFPTFNVGDALDCYYSNNVAFASTITAATGITLKTATANNIVAASTSVILHYVKTGTATWDLYVLGG